jgi:hypothetical protein
MSTNQSLPNLLFKKPWTFVESVLTKGPGLYQNVKNLLENIQHFSNNIMQEIRFNRTLHFFNP